MCVRTTTQAIYLSILSYPLILAFIPLIKYMFIAAGQDPSLVIPATSYSRILMAGSIVVLLRTAFGSFFIGIGKTRIVMYSNLAGGILNIPLNYALIFGKFGFPEMGIRGAAAATICGSILTLILQV